MVYLVRVRGIYATALAALFSKRGFLLADLSRVLQDRLRLPTSDAPPHVTVKSGEDRIEDLVIVGYPWEAGVEAEKAIIGETLYASVSRARLGVHTVIDAVGEGGCHARGPEGLRVRVVEGDCPDEGERVRLSIVREALEPGEELQARRGVDLVGLRVVVRVPGSGVSFSRHIREERRLELLSELQKVSDRLRGVHVRFRSGAQKGSPREAVSEALELAEKALSLASEKPGEPGVVERGEYLSIVNLPLPGKKVMDELRRSLWPTVTLHHSLKAGGEMESMLVDFAEEGMRRGLWGPESGGMVLVFVAEKLSGRRVTITHFTPERRALRLGPFTVASVKGEAREGYVKLRLERVFRSRGVLDALNVEKMPGDRGVTYMDTREWVVLHEYVTADGRLLGVYANINTPPEVSSQGIRYLDLHVDVVKRPGEPAEIVDVDKLENAYSEGRLTEALYKKALEEAEKTRKRLDSLYP